MVPGPDVSTELSPVDEGRGVALDFVFLFVEFEFKSVLFHELPVDGFSQMRFTDAAAAANSQPVRGGEVQRRGKLGRSFKHLL